MLTLNTISEANDSDLLSTRCLPWCRCRTTTLCESSLRTEFCSPRKKGTIVDALWEFGAAGALGDGHNFFCDKGMRLKLKRVWMTY